MAHRWLGNVQENQGRKRAAVAELAMTLRMDGSLDDAKKDLRRLK
jgi:hypothetical protein